MEPAGSRGPVPIDPVASLRAPAMRSAFGLKALRGPPREGDVVVFGFGKKNKGKAQQVGDEENLAEEREEVDYVVFQGALDGREVNLAANARLAEAALVPTKELVTDAILRRAEAIRVDPKGDRAIVTLMIDGVPYSGGRMAKQQGHAITQMAKLLSGLDIKIRNKPQSGGIKAELEGKKYELRIKSAPAEGGVEKLQIAVRNLSKSLQTPDELGFSPEMKTKIREITSGKSGIILITGPPSSGTTTTAFAVLRTVDAYQYTIYTIADRMGRDLPNVVPFEVIPGDDPQTTLDRAVRQEADVIYLDPLRDKETAQLMFKNQSRVALISEYAGKDTKDVAHAVVDLIQLVGDPKLVTDGLAAIISQKLIRLLCTKCRAAYRPNPKIIAKVGLPPETRTLFRPPPTTYVDDRGNEVELEPCNACGGVGYLGRVAMFEMIEMTDEMKKIIAKSPTPGDIKTAMRAQKMLTLQREGMRLVVEGKTSLEELQRVFAAKQPPKK